MHVVIMQELLIGNQINYLFNPFADYFGMYLIQKLQ